MSETRNNDKVNDWIRAERAERDFGRPDPAATDEPAAAPADPDTRTPAKSSTEVLNDAIRRGRSS